MKKFFLSLLFGLFCLALQSQNYFAFPTDTARWNCLFWWNGSPTNQFVYNYSYIMQGDTIIQGKQYKKIYTQYIASPQVQPDYIGGLREDTLKQIFFFPSDDMSSANPAPHQFSNDTAEHLLYTFNNLSIGDTLPINTAFTTIWVSGIDSILLGTEYRKRYEIINHDLLFQPEYWIEGIGSTKDLLSPFTYEFEWWLFTLCYSDSVSYFINPPFGADSCHYLLTGIHSSDPVSAQMNIYPSPSLGKMTIETEGIDRDIQMFIYSVHGTILLGQTIKPPKTEIDVSILAKGPYVIKLITPEGMIVRKFIKE